MVTFSGTYRISPQLFTLPPSGARVNSFRDIAGTASEPGVNLYMPSPIGEWVCMVAGRFGTDMFGKKMVSYLAV